MKKNTVTSHSDGHKFPYEWYMRDGYPAKGIKKHGCKVFGTFICGGGSSMGYKLAGYEHLGGVELDPKIAAIYKDNHHPKYLFNEDIRDFNMRDDLPEELYNLDILDGSPPCTTFSMAGKREKTWGKEKRFAEGQKLQRLDDLCFVYAETIKKLKPKVYILENVSGLAKGNAKAYLKEIINKIPGYRNQVFLLNGATMGVPQTRTRVFIVGLRLDLCDNLPPLAINVNEKPIPFGEIREKNVSLSLYHKPDSRTETVFQKRIPSDTTLADVLIRTEHKNSLFNHLLIHDNRVCGTIATNRMNYIPYSEKHARCFSDTETMKVASWPLDYKYTSSNQLYFLTGMSVAPIMMAHVTDAIYKQWLSRINKK